MRGTVRHGHGHGLGLGRGPGPGRGPGLAEVAVAAHRLAVLLGTGVSPARALEHVRADLLEADPGFRVLRDVATATGSPFACGLRAYASALRVFAAAERDATVALSGPRATSRLVLVLPGVAVVFGALLGEDTIGVLLGTAVGWTCLGAGSGLMLAGWAWSRQLLRRAGDVDRLPGLMPELMATAMSGGVSVARARAIVESACERERLAGDWTPVDEAVRLGAAAGAPVAELLRAESEEARAAAIAEARARAERLSVTLMLPLGVCVLPAFVAVGVVPMMVAIVGSTIATI